jgi:hypothetical protein
MQDYIISDEITLNSFQDVVNQNKFNLLNPLPSTRFNTPYIMDQFYSNSHLRAVEFADSSNGRYIFYLYRDNNGQVHEIYKNTDGEYCLLPKINK